jgi:uncharacterized membrane protein
MAGPPRTDDGRDWHHLIEHYTPDGAFGRVLFTALGTLAVGPSLLLAAVIWLGGTVSPFLVLELLGLAALVGGVASFLLSVVVLWPVYLSLIGNLASADAYAVGGRSAGGGSRSRGIDADDLDAGDGNRPAAILKRRYAAGEITREEFERRLDSVMDADRVRERARQNGSTDRTTESGNRPTNGSRRRERESDGGAR